MKVTELTKMFERIKKHYNTFGYDDGKVAEWHRFLKDYNNESILKNLDTYILEYHDRPPTMSELIRGADKEITEERKPVFIQCDICKKKILVGDDWDVFETHHRRCSKIDFIHRRRGINLTNKNDYEIDRAYRESMEEWKREHPDICLTSLFSRI